LGYIIRIKLELVNERKPFFLVLGYVEGVPALKPQLPRKHCFPCGNDSILGINNYIP